MKDVFQVVNPVAAGGKVISIDYVYRLTLNDQNQIVKIDFINNSLSLFLQVGRAIILEDIH